MYKIKTLNEIAQEGMSLLTSEFSLTDGADADGIILRSYNLLDKPLDPGLLAIVRAGVGVNNIPLETCAKAGVVVFNTPGANANGVKEIVIAALMLSSRDIIGAIEWTKTLHDQGDAIVKLVENGKSDFAGPEIKGKTLGVIGLGAVGVLIANAASALGMNVLGYDPYISIASAWGLSRKVKRAKSYDEVFAEADYLTLHVPLVDATRGIVNTVNIKKMKDGVRVLNFARGELIDDLAMTQALESGKISRYVTDFPNAATMGMKNVIMIPHLGASTPESEINCAVMAVNQMMDYLLNGNIRNSVNYPECDMGLCRTDARITINHQNIPNMVGQITSILGNHGVNIATMQNMSRKDWAYTVLDVEGKLEVVLKSALETIPGVVRVRILENNN